MNLKFIKYPNTIAKVGKKNCTQNWVRFFGPPFCTLFFNTNDTRFIVNWVTIRFILTEELTIRWIAQIYIMYACTFWCMYVLEYLTSVMSVYTYLNLKTQIDFLYTYMH